MLDNISCLFAQSVWDGLTRANEEKQTKKTELRRIKKQIPAVHCHLGRDGIWQMCHESA